MNTWIRTAFNPPPCFFWIKRGRGNRSSKKGSRKEGWGQVFKKFPSKSGGQRKNTKSVGLIVFFILVYQLLATMATDTTYRKSSLENLFLKVVVPGISKHWSYHTDLLVFCHKFPDFLDKMLSVSEYLN